MHDLNSFLKQIYTDSATSMAEGFDVLVKKLVEAFAVKKSSTPPPHFARLPLSEHVFPMYYCTDYLTVFIAMKKILQIEYLGIFN